jgi:hypothetical protein
MQLAAHRLINWSYPAALLCLYVPSSLSARRASCVLAALITSAPALGQKILPRLCVCSDSPGKEF